MSSAAVDVSRYAPRFSVLVDNRELSAEATHMVKSVQVVHELNKASSFSIDVQDENLNGRFRWLDKGGETTGLFDFGNHVVVALGYAARLERMSDGLVQGISASFSEGIAPSFTVNGLDTAYDVMTEPRSSETYRNLKDSEIVARVALAAGLQAETELTPVEHPVKTKPSGQSYLQFLQQLARDNNFQFTFAGNKLVFVRPKLGDPPAMTLTWGRDLLSFRPQIDTSQQLSEVVVRAWDPVERRLIEERATAGEEPRQEAGRKLGSELARDRKRSATRVISNRPVRSPLEARQIAQAELAQTSSRLVKGSGEVVGLLELRPAMHIALDGLGAWFNGKYHVTKVTHTVSDGGFRSRFEAERNAL
jgi:phage protein D